MVVVKKGKIVDPKRPKRPLNAYMMFAINQRDLIIENNPDMKFGDVAKGTARKWKNLSSRQIELFKEKAKLGAKKYHNRMDIYKRQTIHKKMLVEIWMT